jgi:hypothetical protein
MTISRLAYVARVLDFELSAQHESSQPYPITGFTRHGIRARRLILARSQRGRRKLRKPRRVALVIGIL